MVGGERVKSSQRYACFVDKRHFRVYNEWHEARNVPRNLRQVSLPRRSVGVLLRVNRVRQNKRSCTVCAQMRGADRFLFEHKE